MVWAGMVDRLDKFMDLSDSPKGAVEGLCELSFRYEISVADSMIRFKKVRGYPYWK